MNNLNGVHNKPDRDEWYTKYEDVAGVLRNFTDLMVVLKS